MHDCLQRGGSKLGRSQSTRDLSRTERDRDLLSPGSRNSKSKVSWVKDLYPYDQDTASLDGRPSGGLVDHTVNRERAGSISGRGTPVSTTSGLSTPVDSNLNRNWSLTTGDLPMLVKSSNSASRQNKVDLFNRQNQVSHVTGVPFREPTGWYNPLMCGVNFSEPRVQLLGSNSSPYH